MINTIKDDFSINLYKPETEKDLNGQILDGMNNIAGDSILRYDRKGKLISG